MYVHNQPENYFGQQMLNSSPESPWHELLKKYRHMIWLLMMRKSFAKYIHIFSEGFMWKIIEQQESYIYIYIQVYWQHLTGPSEHSV